MFNFLQAVIGLSPLGRIYATTAKSYYVSGEMVTGNIVVEARKPIRAHGIDLKLTGYEKTEWHDRTFRTHIIEPSYTDGQGVHHPARTEQIPQFRRHRGKTNFFTSTQRIYAIGGGMLAPGTYTFPFQYQLPEGLPGSFYERSPLQPRGGEEYIDEDGIPSHVFYDSDDEYDGQYCRGPHGYQRSNVLAVVMYKLKVTLDVAGLFDGPNDCEDLHCRVPLTIHPKLAAGLQPAMQELTQDVIVCCCCNKGKCSVCARFDKLAYVAGEVADVRCDITNDSTSDLKTRVILRRYLELKSSRGGRAITEDLVTQTYAVVKGNEKAIDRPMPLQLVGERVKPSTGTSGGLVSCHYDYLVECAVSMGTDIYLKMPVTVYAPQPPPIAQPTSPAPPAIILPDMPAMPLQSPSMASPPPQQPYQQYQSAPGPQSQSMYPSNSYQQQVPQGQYPPQQGQYPPPQQGQYPPQQGQYPPPQQQQYPPQQQGQYPPQQQQGQYPPQGPPQQSPPPQTAWQQSAAAAPQYGSVMA